MNRLFIFLLIITIALSSCSSTPKVISAQSYFDEYGGNIKVFQEILSMTDCNLLQGQFDQASKNNNMYDPGTAQFKYTTGYMVAADTRMKDLGCY